MKHLTTIMMTTIALTTFSLVGVNSAMAQQPSYSNGRISVSQMTKQLEDQGYRIREIDRKSNGWEVEVTDRNHQKIELRVNSQGQITRQKFDD